MVLYTLVNSYKNGNLFNHDIIGSTFESDTAIYLYFLNKPLINGELYFVFIDIEFDLVKKHVDMDTTLEFFPVIENNKIIDLSLYRKDSIYRVQSNYFSDVDICSESIEKETEFTRIILEYENYKNELLPDIYDDQDNRVFSAEQNSEILHVAVLNYSIKGENHTILAGASYFDNICAMLLNKKIKELNADWCSFHFKTMYIYKADINQFLNKNTIRFYFESNDPLINVMLSPVSTDEYNEEFDYLVSDYLDIAERNESEFKEFIENDWVGYKEYFIQDQSKDIVVLEEENIINIQDIKNNHLVEKTDWHDGMELIEYLIKDNNLSFSLFNNIGYPSVFLSEDNKLIAFGYLKDCLTISTEVEDKEDLNLLIFVSQKTNFSINNKTKHRVFGLTVDKHGILPLTKDISKKLYIENHTNEYDNCIFMDAKESLKVLKLDFKLKDLFSY